MNDEHYRKLKEGIETWNQWRRDNPGVRPDLSEARLIWADLRDANLRGGDLRDVNLSSGDLRGADLTWADLRGADLTWADLRGADLRRADLTWAILMSTTIGNVDLQSVIGLASVKHNGPSTIGIDTIYRSNGKIPEVFLRRAGVPEDFIAYIPALVGALQPIEFYSCFISYSTRDDDFAQRLYADLQAAKVRCWFAPEDLKIGDRFRQRIEDAIQVYDKLLLILSEASIESDWVQTEAEAALERERSDQHRGDVLFPIRLDEAVIQTTMGWAADLRRRRHIGDFSRWKDHDSYQAAFKRLMRDLNASAERGRDNG